MFEAREAKRLVAVSATSMSVIANLEALKKVPCIEHPVQFEDSKIQVLIDSGNEVNAMTSIYMAQIGFIIKSIDVGAQKINGSTPKTNRMVTATFLVRNKKDWNRFFKEIFLLADTSMK